MREQSLAPRRIFRNAALEARPQERGAAPGRGTPGAAAHASGPRYMFGQSAALPDAGIWPVAPVLPVLPELPELPVLPDTDWLEDDDGEVVVLLVAA